MSRKATIIILVSWILITGFGIVDSEEIGTISQPLVGGSTVDQQTRRELGLLTLITPKGSCSASLLNDNWAITASHCIDDIASAELVTLIADWSATGQETRKAAKIRSFEWTHNLDIALIMVTIPFPRHSSVTYPQLSYRPTSDLMGQRIELYGRGISTLARQSGANAIPTQSDGLFRTSEFEVYETSEGTFQYRSIQGAGSAIAGGDSGGPSYFRVWDDPNSSNREIVRLLAGVHSNCRFECLAGQICRPGAWMWVTNIPNCKDASIEPILNELQTQIAFIPEKPYEERSRVPTDVMIAKPDVATAPSGSMKKYITKESNFQEKPYDNVRMYAAPALDFNGTWTTITGANSNYTMALTQNGTTVDGSYVSPDGAFKGSISGTVSDGTLVFRWSQNDGQKGTGKFTLSQDGKTFQGSWGYSDDSNVVEGSWNGTRQ